MSSKERRIRLMDLAQESVLGNILEKRELANEFSGPLSCGQRLEETQ